MAMLEVSVNNFESEVLKSEKKVLVDFNANWCGPCRMLRPVLEELSNNNKIISVNVDDNEELAVKYGVSSIPCLVLFENGKELNRIIGLRSKDELEKFLGGE